MKEYKDIKIGYLSDADPRDYLFVYNKKIFQDMQFIFTLNI